MLKRVAQLNIAKRPPMKSSRRAKKRIVVHSGKRAAPPFGGDQPKAEDTPRTRPNSKTPPNPIVINSRHIGRLVITCDPVGDLYPCPPGETHRPRVDFALGVAHRAFELLNAVHLCSAPTCCNCRYRRTRPTHKKTARATILCFAPHE
jgi:hypothetical protein